MVLIFLGALCQEFLKARPNMIGSSIIKSLEITYHFLREIVPSESQNSAIVETRDRSALAVQDRTIGDRGCMSDLGTKGRDGGHLGGRVGEVIYNYYCKESSHTKYNCPLFQEK